MFAARRAWNLMFFDKCSHLLLRPRIHRTLDLDSFFRTVIFDQLISTETLMTFLTIHQRIGKSAQMSGSHPCLRIHQDRTVHTDIVRRLLHELLPPCFFYIIL